MTPRAAEARCLIKRLEIQFTPWHGSWLNIAEIELSVLLGNAKHQNVARQAKPGIEKKQKANSNQKANQKPKMQELS